MYKIIKSVIESKDFKLEDILHKINKMYIEDKISEAEKSELDELARSKAKAENSYASADSRLDDVYSKIYEILERLDKLEGKGTEEDTETIEPVDEYPEFVQPTGAHDAYQIGDKVTYNGKKYICKLENCVWSPDTYPQGWEEVVEETEDNVEV